MRFVLCLILAILATAPLRADELILNYSGRLKATGVNQSGLFYFKFAIVDETSRTVWSNDGTSVGGFEPTSRTVVVNVQNGTFTVPIGASAMAMEPLTPSMFTTPSKLKLRVWVGTSPTAVELLLPDRDLTNPQILGILSTNASIVYVNPLTGNDANNGNVPQFPKRTIRAAWNSLSPLITSTATLQLANGTYRESVRLTGKNAMGGRIIIRGNPTSASLVRITGALQTNETTITQQYGFDVFEQRNLNLIGLSFDHFGRNINITSRSNVEIQNCIIKQFQSSGISMDNSEFLCRNCEFMTPAVTTFNVAIVAPYGGFFNLINCNFHDLTGSAISFGRLGQARISGTIFKNITVNAIGMGECAVLSFDPPSSSIQNTPVGISAEKCSSVTYYNQRVAYTNVPTHINLLTSSYGLP